MLSDSIAALRGVLKEQLETYGKRKGALNSTCFAPPQAKSLGECIEFFVSLVRDHVQ